MAVTGTPTRLSKAAREYNVGLSTIVEFLAKNGFEISNSPNTKLSPEMYELLNLEFQSQKTVKEEAEKIGLDYTDHQTISIDDKVKSERNVDDEDDFDDVFIKETLIKRKEEEQTAKVTEKVEPPKEEVKEEKPKKKEEKKETEVEKPSKTNVTDKKRKFRSRLL